MAFCHNKQSKKQKTNKTKKSLPQPGCLALYEVTIEIISPISSIFLSIFSSNHCLLLFLVQKSTMFLASGPCTCWSLCLESFFLKVLNDLLSCFISVCIQVLPPESFLEHYIVSSTLIYSLYHFIFTTNTITVQVIYLLISVFLNMNASRILSILLINITHTCAWHIVGIY